jgi:hypothetical protein
VVDHHSRYVLAWVRLGIRHVRIQPSRPEQNGAHERMHRTLKAETTRPPADSRRGQQRKFGACRHLYNHERPHEAFGQQPPARLWQPAVREHPRTLSEPEYPRHHLARLVRCAGTIRLRGHLFVSRALADEYIGLEETADGMWSIYSITCCSVNSRSQTIGSIPDQRTRGEVLPMFPVAPTRVK